jgi:hypothetical protein
MVLLYLILFTNFIVTGCNRCYWYLRICYSGNWIITITSDVFPFYKPHWNIITVFHYSFSLILSFYYFFVFHRAVVFPYFWLKIEKSSFLRHIEQNPLLYLAHPRSLQILLDLTSHSKSPGLKCCHETKRPSPFLCCLHLKSHNIHDRHIKKTFKICAVL